MSKSSSRFFKLECSSILKRLQDPRCSVERFARLEIQGHAVEVEIHGVPKGEYFDCPACGKRSKNPEASYCYYCGYMSDKAKQQSLATGLKPWEVRCICGEACNRSQERCLSCGAIVAPAGSNAATGRDTKEFRITRPIAVTIDDHVYCSTDKVLPENVKELMRQIDKKGYSKELVDDWVRQSKSEIDSNLAIAREQEQQELQVRAKRFFVGAILVIAAVLYIILLSSPRR